MKFYKIGYKYKCQYLDGDEWKVYVYNYDLPEDLRKMDYVPEICFEEYYLDGRYHRLSGPAWVYRIGSVVQDRIWYIDGRSLPRFGLIFGDGAADRERLFRYGFDFPGYLAELIELSLANHWLSSEDILLMKTCFLFK